MAPKVRIAVVGVGHLGQHHARLLAAMEHVELVAVVDTRPGRAAEIAAKYGGEPHTDSIAVLDRVDAVSVAVPTESHVAVAMPFIERGVPVLVEKPIAASLRDADRLMKAAEQRGVILAAGHTERFNPAVAAAL